MHKTPQAPSGTEYCIISMAGARPWPLPWLKRSGHRLLVWLLCLLFSLAERAHARLLRPVLHAAAVCFHAAGFSLLYALLAVPAGRPSGLWMRARRYAGALVALGGRAATLERVFVGRGSARGRRLARLVAAMTVRAAVLRAVEDLEAQGLDVRLPAHRALLARLWAALVPAGAGCDTPAHGPQPRPASSGARRPDTPTDDDTIDRGLGPGADGGVRKRRPHLDSAAPEKEGVHAGSDKANRSSSPAHSPSSGLPDDCSAMACDPDPDRLAEMVSRMPAVPSAEWKALGFQGTDPGTDLRSLGVFGLMQLVHYAERHAREARAILARSLGTSGACGAYWPFAAVALNVSGAVVALARDGHLDRRLGALGPPSECDACGLDSGSVSQSLGCLAGAGCGSPSSACSADTSACNARGLGPTRNPGGPAGSAGGRHRAVPGTPTGAIGALAAPYAEMMRAFDAAWVSERPANVFAFVPIFARVRDAYARSLHAVL